MDRELFRFEDSIWDITGLRLVMLRDPTRFGPVEIPIDDKLMHSVSLYNKPDEQRIVSMDERRRDTPILVVIQENGMGRVVDGNHRLLRKHRDGCSTITCYLFPWEIAAPFVQPAEYES